MVTTAAARNSSAESDPTTNGGFPARPVDAAAHAWAPPASGLDAQLAPLRTPAVVLGVVLLAAGVVALVVLRAWCRDYGGPLVIVAYLQYLGVAATMTWWGLSGVLPRRRNSIRRGRTPEEDGGRHTAGPGRKPMIAPIDDSTGCRSAAEAGGRSRDRARPWG
ncbi:hypothetical protein [Nocardia sp. CY41]|uniref:hypothetical protein n=1 Tax=Nocardia sp. CY41 TaxID=2608686 RepID=UPI001356CE07|nr:hypothetical protein [Nocardia sp. CY41]